MAEMTGSVHVSYSPLLECFFRLIRQNKRSLVIPNERLITQLGGRSIPALWVAPQKTPLGVARHIVGITKPLSSRHQLASFQERQ